MNPVLEEGLAGLAVVRGVLHKAVRYFQMALEANPEDLDAALQLLVMCWWRRGMAQS